MRGIHIKTLTLSEYRCETCGVHVSCELHTAQGGIWLTPIPHKAPCGEDCISGGIEHPFLGHRGDGKCSNPTCSVITPKKIKHFDKAQIPYWLFKLLLPVLIEWGRKGP